MIQIIGAVLLACGAAAIGLSMARSVRREVGLLRRLIAALTMAKSEMVCERTPLPELCARIGRSYDGPVGAFFSAAAAEFRRNPHSPPGRVFDTVLEASGFPGECRPILRELTTSLGKYDLDSQIQALDLALRQLEQLLAELMDSRKARCKSYGAVGVCAGLALLIILI